MEACWRSCRICVLACALTSKVALPGSKYGMSDVFVCLRGTVEFNSSLVAAADFRPRQTWDPIRWFSSRIFRAVFTFFFYSDIEQS